MSAVLKRAIAETGKPLFALSRETGINQSNLWRFVHGETSLRLDRADVLARHLGLELVKKMGKRNG